MEWIAIAVAVLFALLGLVCLVLVVIGLPGNWIMLLLAAGIEYADRWWLPEGAQQTFSVKLFVIGILLCGLGELLEFGAGVIGAKKGGSSKHGMTGAMIGGMVGAILGTGIPMPIIGTLIGGIFGSFAGAMIGEVYAAKKVEDSIKPAIGAAVGKVLGTLSKLPIGAVLWVLLTWAAFR